MNGSAHRTATVLDIQLKRGPAGLGFNIVGGIDQQYMANDSGIYVAKIKEDGAAALDGRLQEGDKILEINGQKLENMSHGSVVELFRTAGDDVHLRVLQRPPLTANGPANTRSDGESSPSFNLAIVGLLLGAVLVAFMLSKRAKVFKRPF